MCTRSASRQWGAHLDWSPDGEYLAVPGQIAGRGAVPYRLDSGQGWSTNNRDHAARKDHRRLEPGVLSRRKIARVPARRLQRRGRRVRRARRVEVRRGASRSTTGTRSSVTWTPDGRSIVFSSDRRRNSVLWRVRASGGDPERIAGVAENAADPAFSRDGRMAYAQFFQDANIWRIDTEGKQPPVKVISSTQYDSSPQYSPDGSRVAFRSNRSGSNEIWVSDSNGRIPVQLTKYGGPSDGNAALVAGRDEYRIRHAGPTVRRISTWSPRSEARPGA